MDKSCKLFIYLTNFQVNDIKDKSGLYPIRILTAWSKTISNVRITYADTKPLV